MFTILKQFCKRYTYSPSFKFSSVIQLETANIAMGRKALKRKREESRTDKARYSLQMNSGVVILEDKTQKASDINILLVWAMTVLVIPLVLNC